MQTELITDQQRWDELVDQHQGHPLQLWGWGEVKARHGWRAERVAVCGDAGVAIGGAQLLYKRMPWPLGDFCYMARGPFCADADREAVLTAICRHAKGRAFVVSAEPDWTDFPLVAGWRKARNDILLPYTIVLDITRSADDLLADMTKKTRQYIRKSERDDIVVRPITQGEIAGALDIYKATAVRAGFALHGDDYYADIYHLMGESSPVYGAFLGDEMVAFLWLAVSGETAFELYGGVTEAGQQTRANYILKWRAIEAMKTRGVRRYDMNGLLNDGVSGFKRGFSSVETHLAGTYDYPLAMTYVVWDRLLPLAKKVVRVFRA